jgi:diguanylate cyclase (GGDEF)-like protein
MSPSTILALAKAGPTAGEVNLMRDVASHLGEEMKAGTSRLLRLLVRALNRVAETEQKMQEKDRIIEQLRSMALTDCLTGLINRRGFEDQVKRAVAAAQRFDERGVLVYLDLDDFKSINDDIGHDAGDATLRYVAEFLRNSVRQTDVVARLGGDEFAILMSQTNHGEGEKRTRTLQTLLNNSHFTFEGHLISLSASMGIAPFVAGCEARALIRRADAAMYADKARRQMLRPLDRLRAVAS